MAASGARANGSITIDVSALIALPGDPASPAFDAIPVLTFVARAEDYARNDNLSGMEMSFNTIGLLLKDGTTVGEK